MITETKVRGQRVFQITAIVKFGLEQEVIFSCSKQLKFYNTRELKNPLGPEPLFQLSLTLILRAHAFIRLPIRLAYLGSVKSSFGHSPF